MHLFRTFGLIGTSCIVLGIAISVLLFRGRQGERFSPLNHFISELGEVGVSPAAWVFNLGLILGGMFMLPYLFGLGIALKSTLGWLGATAGIVTALGVGAVGIFPMNNLPAHVAAAMTYFRAGLIMAFFFGLAILFQPAGHIGIPKIANLLSLLAFIVYASFLILLARTDREHNPTDLFDPHHTPERPPRLPLAFMEWAVFFISILWLFGLAFFI